MLSVNFTSTEDRNESGKEWILFLQDYKLTAPEIIEAYKMALRRELRNDQNETIKVFPNLSLISAGEIMKAFIEFKRNSAQYQAGKEKLNELMNPEIILTPEEQEEKMKKMFDQYVFDVQNKIPNVGRRGFMFFIWLYKAEKLKEFLPSLEDLDKNQQFKMKRLVGRENKKPLFYSLSEIKNLNRMIREGLKLPVSNYVVQEIRDEIVLNYVKSIIK